MTPTFQSNLLKGKIVHIDILFKTTNFSLILIGIIDEKSWKEYILIDYLISEGKRNSFQKF